MQAQQQYRQASTHVPYDMIFAVLQCCMVDRHDNISFVSGVLLLALFAISLCRKAVVSCTRDIIRTRPSSSFVPFCLAPYIIYIVHIYVQQYPRVPCFQSSAVICHWFVRRGASMPTFLFFFFPIQQYSSTAVLLLLYFAYHTDTDYRRSIIQILPTTAVRSIN